MKLDFNNLRPLERRKELDWLLMHFDDILSNGSAAILIQASAGTGKSTLLQSFLDEVGPKALICYGKFEERTTASEPFAAIIDAMDTLIARILTSGEGQRWGKRIRQSLDVEIDLLEDLFPSFRGVVKAGRRSSESTEGSDSSFYFDGFGNMTDKEWRFERLRLALRSLFRCLSSYAPVVFCLDDIHWIDPDSLALMRTLILDSKKGRKFLFLGSARPNSVLALDLPRDKLKIFPLPGLTVDEIAQLVSQLLLIRQEPEQQNNQLQMSVEIQSLAECLHRHTVGNAFGVIHYLRRLHDQHHFTWDEQAQQWTFDVHATILSVTVMEHPAQVVRETLQSLPAEDRLALLVAASFGTSYFEVTTIVHALEVLEPRKGSVVVPEESLKQSRRESVDPYFVQNRIRTMRQTMSRLAEKGFVIRQGTTGSDDQYKFAHDNIREAAYSLLPEGRERHKVHLGIGRQLRLWMDTESELGTSLSHETLVLHAAKHLNVAANLVEDPWELVDLAELNYQAAELVAQKSSFFPALEYLQYGVQLLGKEGWKNHFALAQKLSVALTRIQYSLGLFDECLRTADIVIAHTKSWRKERPVYHTKIFCLMQQNRFPEALDLVFKILKDLGQAFPKRFLNMHVQKDMKKAAKLLKGRTNEALLSLPTVEDEDINDSIEFMERLAEMSMRGADPAYFNLFAFRAIHLTLEKGLFPLSTYAFMSWAMCKAEMGDHDEATRFGKLALKIAENGLGRFRDTRVRAAYWITISPWRNAYRDSIEPMTEVIRELWDYSAVDFVHWHAPPVCRLLLAAGHDLRLTLAEYEKMSECLVDYKQEIHWRLLASFYQTTLNLMGKTDKIIEEELVRKEWEGHRGALLFLELNSMMTAYFFNEYEQALDAMERLKQYLPAVTGPDCWVALRVFYSGLVLAAMGRKKCHRTLKRKAQAEALQLGLWADQGNINCRHMHALLQAELLRANANTDKEEVLSLYAKAGDGASSLKMIHHQALASELAGRFVCEKGDRHLARMYVYRGIELYERWGAAGKVKQLRAEFDELLLKKKEGLESTNELSWAG